MLVILVAVKPLLSITGASFADESLSIASLPGTIMCRMDTKRTTVASDKDSEMEQRKDKSRDSKSKDCTSRIWYGVEHKAEALDLELPRSGG
jgi:hypothetical protein